MVVSLHTKQKTVNLQNYTQEVEEGNSGTLMHGVVDLTRLAEIFHVHGQPNSTPATWYADPTNCQSKAKVSRRDKRLRKAHVHQTSRR